MNDVKPRFFKKQSDVRAWFEKNHDKKTELWMGLYRVNAAHKGVVYKQALDEALCFGWIDAQKKGIDDETWMQRFTPRKKGSIWSKVNLKRAEELIASGAMTAAGKRVYDARDLKKAGTSYSFENAPLELTKEMAREFKADAKAWTWFTSQAPSYQKVAKFWVMNAKKEETREKRFRELVADSAKGQRVKPLREYPRKK